MRIRQHVNPLKSDFFEIPDLPRIIPPSSHLLEVELGSAEAYFLFERAVAHPEGRFVGVEIRRDLVDEANREARARGLCNAESVFANVSVDLPRLFAPGSVRRFHLNFPDPWFKARQHKRRILTGALVETLHGLLTPDGEISLMTDIFELAMDGMALLEAEPPRRFTNAHAPWSFLPTAAFVARSRRERQCADDGSRVWRLLYRRV